MAANDTDGTNRQVVVVELPDGKLAASNFEVRDAPVTEPGDGQVLVRTLWLSACSVAPGSPPTSA